MRHDAWMRARTIATSILILTAMSAASRAQTTQPTDPKAPAGEKPELALSPAATTTTAPPEKTAADAIEDFIQKTKNPVPWFKWGADMRLRDEYLHNQYTLANGTPGHDEHYQRYRGRWWGSFLPTKDIEVYTRITWEGRNLCWPQEQANPFNPNDPIKRGWVDERDDVLLDNVYLKINNVLGLPLTIKAGRQDIMLGDGWWTGDGTPLDGSRTFFYDAIRATYDIQDIKTSVELIWLQVDAQNKAWFPYIYQRDIPPLLTEQDEQGAILYITNRSIAKMEISPYFVYKNSAHEMFLKKRSGIDADIYMFGTRIAGEISEHWRYRADIAAQFGNKNWDGTNNQSICALGSNNRLTYSFNDKWKNELFLDYEFLSGDDPKTRTTYEGFDTLWGRYPRWTESGFIWTRESRIFDFTNLHRIGPGWSGKPIKSLELAFCTHFLFSDESRPSYPSAPAMFAGGCYRGTLMIPYAKYTINDHMFVRAMPEIFWPGDFYSKANNDAAVFWRFEINLTW